MPGPRELMNRLILLASRDAARLRDYTARRALVPAARRLSVVSRSPLRAHARDRPHTSVALETHEFARIGSPGLDPPRAAEIGRSADREFGDRAKTRCFIGDNKTWRVL